MFRTRPDHRLLWCRSSRYDLATPQVMTWRAAPKQDATRRLLEAYMSPSGFFQNHKPYLGFDFMNVDPNCSWARFSPAPELSSYNFVSRESMHLRHISSASGGFPIGLRASLPLCGADVQTFESNQSHGQGEKTQDERLKISAFMKCTHHHYPRAAMAVGTTPSRPRPGRAASYRAVGHRRSRTARSTTVFRPRRRRHPRSAGCKAQTASPRSRSVFDAAIEPYAGGEWRLWHQRRRRLKGPHVGQKIQHLRHARRAAPVSMGDVAELHRVSFDYAYIASKVYFASASASPRLCDIRSPSLHPGGA